MTKYYVNPGGNYLGGFDGVNPPSNAIEVPFAPDHALDVWDGTRFVPHPPTKLERDRSRIGSLPDTEPVKIGDLRDLGFI